MNNFNEIETTINNEYDYSNIIPVEDKICEIVKFCDQMYETFAIVVEQDEKQNEKLKYEFKNYNFKSCYGAGIEINIRRKNYNNLECKNYNAFLELVNNKQLRNIESLNIILRLDYKRGKNDNLKEHNNLFNIIFKPYEIKFIRKSNYNEDSMNQIEDKINNLLKNFSVANSIFCYKEN